ncbi:MAG TPA: DUF5947 family protein [Candidatus Elarobacter sp.]|jgi:hypothetical protein|nr:DUF5947 family protein [Candidatus Elarobacter sp.]
MTFATPQLRRMIAQAATPRAVVSVDERCEMCSAAIAPVHGHVLELAGAELLCVCRPCALLFDHDAAGGERFRLVPDRRKRVDGLRFDELAWRSLRIPVDLAFFVRGDDGAVTARYPSPAGPITSLLPLDAWAEIDADNPVLSTMRPEVEALLVDRTGGEARGWIVGIDACYELIALFRRHWTGLSGGDAVWAETRKFFDALSPAAPSLA